MALLPMYIDDKLEDGTLIKLLPFCKNNCERTRCKEYYKTINECSNGIYVCPYGLNSYISNNGKNRVIFTGIKIRNKYDKKKAKATESQQYVYNPVINENDCFEFGRDYLKNIEIVNESKNKMQAIDELLHETRSLNRRIRTSIDLLWEKEEEEYDDAELLQIIKNAHISSYMISSRFSYFDYTLNPDRFIGRPYKHNVFKKFDKMRKLLKDYMRKNVWITLNSSQQIDFQYLILPTFEILLFILLENAIKYSPNGQPVNVDFNMKGEHLEVIISSMGPYNDENEILKLCEKGFRGENAKALEKSGQGFGLSFAKEICATHGIDISFNSIYSHKDHGIKYGKFNVMLHFEKKEQGEDSYL